ncbi:uncharacterized protein LOC127501516 [Ctenopharyngodon idella]|uniref:uncharacterized protein LOC127501516 n=1 Tax=Ctenopharyngodon idella TaxID=7959 RepID=UPI002232A334|nr:uncharacterized protein LOC127501516 [Ctenopharyngodon idella]
MEKILFFCIFLYRILQITSSDVSEHNVTLLRFQLNGTISLKCNVTENHEITWYHQNPDSGQITLLMSPKDYRNQHMGSNTVSLVINKLNESNSGLYFCGRTYSGHSGYSAMYFDKPIRLQLEDKLTDREDKVHNVTEPPEDVEITDEVMMTERELIFSGVGLAVFVFFLASVVTGGIIYCHGWQKGWAAAKRAGLTDQKSAK